MGMSLFRVGTGVQLDNGAQLLHGVSAPSMDAPVGSMYLNETTGELFTKLTAGAGATNWSVKAEKTYVDQQVTMLHDMVSALGHAINYVGLVSGGTQEQPYDLSQLPTNGKDPGDYYKVATSGWFVVGSTGTPFYANAGDGLVWNLSGSVDKIDNTDPAVAGTTDFITVSGSADTGYTIDIADTFKTRMSTAESGIATLNTTTTGLRTDLDAVTARMTSAESHLTTVDGEIASIQDTNTTQDEHLATLDGEVANLKAFVGATDSYTTGFSSTNYVTNGDSLETAIGKLDASAKSISNHADTIEAAATRNSKETSGNSVTSLSDDIPDATMVKWLVYAMVGTDMVAEEVFASTTGTVASYTTFGVLQVGNSIDGFAVSVDQSAAGMKLTVSTTNSAKLIIKRVAVA